MMIRSQDDQQLHDEAHARATLLCDLMNAAIRNTSPQQRDRNMQVHLAQARGPIANAELLRASMNTSLKLKQSRTDGEKGS